jgi:site-specific recombinase
MGILNFGVSFACALAVALRAREVPKGERRMLLVAVIRAFFKHPLKFFWPPKDAAPAQGHH